MIFKFELYLASRFLKAKKSEKFISVVSTFSLIGIAIGVAALIVVMSVMNGFRAELTSKILSFDGDITISSYNQKLQDYESLISELKNYPEIKNAVPVIEKQVLLAKDDRNIGIIVKGLAEPELREKKIIAANIVSGKIEGFSEGFNAIIGYSLAQNLDARIGDEIKLISPTSRKTFIGTIPTFKTFKISAIYNAGMYDFDSSVVFISLDKAQAFFGLSNNSVSNIEIYSHHPEYSGKLKFKLLESLKENLLINDWQSKNATFFNALKTEKVVMFVILSLIILVAALNIISGLVMLVKDKVTNIAILRTLGASRKNIVATFFICGAVLGVSGTLIGAFLGVAFSLQLNKIRKMIEHVSGTSIFDPVIYYLSELPVEFKTADVVQIVTLSLLLTLTATIYPAFKAASIDPVKELK
jgi:lipoprotein-releasing system permease protein